MLTALNARLDRKSFRLSLKRGKKIVNLNLLPWPDELPAPSSEQSLCVAIAMKAGLKDKDGIPLPVADAAELICVTVRSLNHEEAPFGILNDIRTFANWSRLHVVVVKADEEYDGKVSPYFQIIIPKGEPGFNLLNAIFLFKMSEKGLFLPYERPESCEW